MTSVASGAPLGAGARRARSRTCGGDLDLASQDPVVALARLKPAAGYEVALFASEKEFPELANPLAMTFDTRGRLWVLTSPTYPHVGPDEVPNDKLIILDDTNGDGRADTRQGLRRQALHPDRLRAGRRRRLHLAAAEPDVPAGHQRRRQGRRAPRHPARLRHRGQPPLDPRLHVGPGRRPLLPGGHLPPLAGRDAVRPGPRRLRRRLPLRAAHREAERLRHLSVRQPVGPRHRSLGPELHQRRLERQQLLRHRVLGPRRLPATSSGR